MFPQNSLRNDSDFQNQFTAYLVRAVRRKRRGYIEAQVRRLNREISTDLPEYFWDTEVQSNPMDELLFEEPASFGEVYFKNERLEAALRRLPDRDRDVLFSKVVAEHSFTEIAAEMGLSYKGVAAVYYRAIGKLKKELEASQHEIP